MRIAGHNYTRVRNLAVQGAGTFPGLIRLTRGSTDPSLGANDGDYLYSLNGNLVYEAAGVTTTLGAVGGVGTTWESLYANDAAWALTGAFTITQSTANTITINKTNAGAGAVLTLTNAGTGNDITGNAGNWSVTAAGAATVASLASAGAITCTAISDVTAGATLQVDGNAAGGVNIGSTSTGAITLGRATTITTGGLTVSDTGITVSDGITDLIDNSNVAAGLQLTNNTVTTFGVGGVSTGVVLFRSTSLTTGSLLSLQLTEGTLVGGFYLRCFDVTGGADVLTVGENGAIVITGAGAENDLTLTAGDVLMSDGSLTMTDADNAATISMTNNTSTTANTVLFTGSGVFTGTGTSAFFRITQSGGTTGDMVNIQCDGLTSGTAVRVGSTGTIVTTGRILELIADSATTATGLVDLTADALTTGIGVLLATTSVGLAAGQLLNIDHTASGAIVAKTGQLIDIVSSRNNTAAAAISDDYDTLSILRTNINTDAGGTLNAAGACLYIENIGTQTAGTLADTVNGIELVMTGGTTQDGMGISLTHTGTTAGRAMLFTLSHTTLDGVIQVTANSVNTGNVIVADMNGLTTGIGLELTHTTSVITTGSVCRITSTGIDTGTGQGTLLDLVSSGTTAAEVVSLVADSLATGIGLFMSFDGLTTGEGISVTHTTTVIADGGSLFRLSSTGIDTGGATNGTVFDLSSTAQAAGVVARLTANGLTTGSALLVSSSGTITSAGEGLVNIVGTGITTGFGLKIDLTEATLTTGLYINCYDDTATTSVFTVAEDGLTTITGAAGSTMLSITAGDLRLLDGAIASAVETLAALGAGAVTFVVDSNYVKVTGDGGGNSVTSITGGVAGQLVILEFQDGNVTIVNDNTHAANTIDLVGANTTFADDAILTLVYDGTSWYEVTRSVNA